MYKACRLTVHEASHSIPGTRAFCTYVSKYEAQNFQRLDSSDLKSWQNEKQETEATT